MRVKKALAAVLLLTLVFCLTACGGGGTDAAGKDEVYTQAEALMNGGKYAEAAALYESLGDYKTASPKRDAAKQAKQARYQQATALEEAGDFAAAADIYGALGAYKGKGYDAAKAYKRTTLLYADALFAKGDYKAAAVVYESITGYENAGEQAINCRYTDAQTLLAAGRFDEAFDEFDRIKGTGDVRAIIAGSAELLAARERKYAVGSTVTFGRFEQDGNAKNGAEDIEWIVLARNGENALLLSRNALKCKQYSTNWTTMNWTNSTMRNFLNGDFYKTAFNAAEQAAMITDSAFTDLADPVFILSTSEAERYLKNGDLLCAASPAAAAEGVWTDGSGRCWWWLRDVREDRASLIRNNGTVENGGYYVNYGHAGARPVIMIDITR